MIYFFINHQTRDEFTEIISIKELTQMSSFFSRVCSSRSLNDCEKETIRKNILKCSSIILDNYRKEMGFMKKIFISHSTKDVELIEKFLDFLETAMGISREEVYCTSIDGTISTGQKFIDNIENNIKSAEIVIFIITPQYLKSKFCLAEMGAAWVLNQEIYPLIFNPLDFNILEDTPLKGIQAKMLNSEKNILSMYDEWKKKGIANDKPVTLINKKSKIFLMELNQITEKYRNDEEESDKIKHYKIQNNELLYEINNKDKEIKKLKKYITELEEVKDKEEVLELKRDNLDNYKKFEEMIKDIEKSLNKFSKYITTCIFISEFRNDSFIPNITDSSLSKEVDECVIDGQLKWNENELHLNYSNKSISSAIDKLYKLKEFIEEIDEETFDILIKEYDVENLDMMYRPFWTKILGQTIEI